MWPIDHQSNMRVHEAFGQRYVRLPLRNSPHILQGNALQMDWNELLPSTECSYILGNPPFVGKSLMSGEQKNDMLRVIREAGGIAGAGVLDYVTAWYIKAARYINGTAIEVAFVSTNSISQGDNPASSGAICSQNINSPSTLPTRPSPGLARREGWRTYTL